LELCAAKIYIIYILSHTFYNIPFHPIKSTILFFKVEVLSNVLHEGVKDQHLFEFILNELIWLDENNEYANYPIYWLLSLSSNLGFYPMRIEKRAPYFDLENGQFCESTPNTFSYKTGYEVELLHELIGKEKEYIIQTKLTKENRKKIVSILLHYFELHIPNFNHINTIDVIETIWD
jgi:DNA repair protein RecO (recombination protein O)